MALPEMPTSNFIGLLVGRGSGWAGAWLGSGMIGELLVVAWPGGDQLVSSFRKAKRVVAHP